MGLGGGGQQGGYDLGKNVGNFNCAACISVGF
jgi:hypothetical protein